MLVAGHQAGRCRTDKGGLGGARDVVDEFVVDGGDPGRDAGGGLELAKGWQVSAVPMLVPPRASLVGP